MGGDGIKQLQKNLPFWLFWANIKENYIKSLKEEEGKMSLIKYIARYNSGLGYGRRVEIEMGDGTTMTFARSYMDQEGLIADVARQAMNERKNGGMKVYNHITQPVITKLFSQLEETCKEALATPIATD